MKEIKISRGLVTIVDDEDYELAMSHRWQAHLVGDRKNNHNIHYYAECKTTRAKNRKSIRLHRLIMGAKSGEFVDHINGDSLDNRRKNLRICTHSDNLRAFRLKPWGATSKYRGVYKARWGKKNDMWIAQAKINGVTKHLGSFSSEEEAARKYDEHVIVHYGKFACLNFKTNKEGGDFYSRQKATHKQKERKEVE